MGQRQSNGSLVSTCPSNADRSRTSTRSQRAGGKNSDGPLEDTEMRTMRPQARKEKPSDSFTGMLSFQMVVLQFT